MKCLEVVRHKQRLDKLFDQIRAFSGDLELQSHWARYLCVLVSGFLETSIRAIYGEYATKKAHQYIVNFVESRLKSFQNPNMEQILQIASLFSPEWRARLELDTEGELKDAVDSIVANRNLIAHGQPIRSYTITIRTL
jgi:hypothetical protein